MVDLGFISARNLRLFAFSCEVCEEFFVFAIQQLAAE